MIVHLKHWFVIINIGNEEVNGSEGSGRKNDWKEEPLEMQKNGRN